jgi:D-alanyl-D-alanine carboxypeptidase
MNAKISHIQCSAVFFLLTMLLVSATTPACSSRSPASASVSLPPPEKETVVNVQEEVSIDGTTYSIPPPWAGNRIEVPEFDYTDFRRIPKAHTHEGSEIYILAEAYQPLVALLQAAEKEGIELQVESAYRSEAYQRRIFKRMLAEGRTFEDIVRYVSPPGYSEHMLGRAVDFFPSDWQFADTPAYSWLRENAGRFGFAETYSRSNPLQMPWEAWHWNFTGKEDQDQSITHLSPAGKTRKTEARPLD